MARKTGAIRLRSGPTTKPAPWVPQPWQVEPFHDRTSKVVLLTGSAGGGKSALACAKAHQVAMSYPGAFVLAVRKTRDSMTSSTALFLETQIVRGAARHVKNESTFRYPNGSLLKYTGLATPRERERIRSIGTKGGVEFILVDEANQLTLEDYDELLARLRGRTTPWRQIILCTNPDSESHWINLKLIQGGGATVYYSAAADNRYVDEEYREMLQTLSGVQRERLAEGRWVSATGLVHSNWDAGVNVIDRFDIPPDWMRIGSIDFGYENPTCAQWWALDHDRRMYLYREVYQTKLLPRDLASIILQYSSERVRWVADSAGATERAELARAGVPTSGATKKVEYGLHLVNQRLKRAGDGRPRMMLFADALVAADSRLERRFLPTSTRGEFSGYVWDRRADGGILDRPVKANDHGMDAARYAAAVAESIPTWTIVGPSDE